MKRPEIIKLLREHLDDKPEAAFVDDATLANDLGADSLDGINIVMSFEEACRIEISDADMDLMFGPTATVGMVVGFIEGRTDA